jgi:hypothetical protein
MSRVAEMLEPSGADDTDRLLGTDTIGRRCRTRGAENLEREARKAWRVSRSDPLSWPRRLTKGTAPPATGPSGSLCSAGGGSVPRTFPNPGSGIGSRVAEILASHHEQNPLCRIVNIGSGHRDADHRAARPGYAATAEPSGRLTDDICRRRFVPAPGTAGGACAPIGCRSHRKLRGGAR